jgi:predicted nucleotidyltransferase
MALKTRERVLGELSEIKSIVEERFKVRELALFGSWARGDQQPDSDVDILVDVDPSLGLDFVTLAETLEALLGIPVELVSRRAIKPRHWEYIEDELIYV